MIVPNVVPLLLLEVVARAGNRDICVRLAKNPLGIFTAHPGLSSVLCM